MHVQTQNSLHEQGDIVFAQPYPNEVFAHPYPYPNDKMMQDVALEMEVEVELTGTYPFVVGCGGGSDKLR